MCNIVINCNDKSKSYERSGYFDLEPEQEKPIQLEELGVESAYPTADYIMFFTDLNGIGLYYDFMYNSRTATNFIAKAAGGGRVLWSTKYLKQL